MIDIGLELTLRIVNRDQEQTYRSKVIDFDKKSLYIDIPINVETNKTSHLYPGSKIIVSYIGKDSALYSFSTKIKERTILTVPALVIGKATEVIRKQRREFVRVNTTADIAIHPVDNTFAPFTTMTVDISAGGLSFIMQNNKTIKKNMIVDLTIVLAMQTNNYKYIHCEGKILRIRRAENMPHVVSVKFINMTEKDQQKIIKYTMEKQRTERQRELNL